MQTENQPESENVIDQRGRSVARRPLTIGAVLLVLLLAYFTGQDPLQLLSLFANQGGSVSTVGPYQSTPAEEESKRLLSVTLASTERVWDALFKAQGTKYERPYLVLFSDMVESACGFTESATGPFYCPGDQRLYIDMRFLGQLQQTLGANGDFAAAYVVAHEIGHHVQTLLGLARFSAGRSNADSVKIELQADCLAGIWGHFAARTDLLETGDIEEGINAAGAVGDDRIQSMSGRAVRPESFTHGSSEQRAAAFRRGLESGRLESCLTS